MQLSILAVSFFAKFRFLGSSTEVVERA